MVAGDLVNTAARLQSVAPPGCGARRRGDDARGERRDRLRGGRASRSSRARPRRSRPGGRCGSSPSVAGRVGPTCPSRRSSAATRSSGSSRTLLDAVGRDRRARLVSITGPGGHRQEPARLGVREVHRRDRRRRLLASRPLAVVRRGHHLLGARRDGPPARAGWPRPTTRRRLASGSRRRSPSTCPTTRSGAGSSRRSSTLLGLEPAPAGGRDVALRGVADLLRADRRAGHDDPAVRGPPVGRLRPARLHRPPRSSGRADSRSSS